MKTTLNRKEPERAVRCAEHDGGGVLFHSATGRVFALNTTGARIWEAIERRVTLCDIATDISREYGIPYSTAWEHTMSFLTDLEEESLIETSTNR